MSDDKKKAPKEKKALIGSSFFAAPTDHTLLDNLKDLQQQLQWLANQYAALFKYYQDDDTEMHIVISRFVGNGSEDEDEDEVEIPEQTKNALTACQKLTQLVEELHNYISTRNPLKGYDLYQHTSELLDLIHFPELQLLTQSTMFYDQVVLQRSGLQPSRVLVEMLDVLEQMKLKPFQGKGFTLGEDPDRTSGINLVENYFGASTL